MILISDEVTKVLIHTFEESGIPPAFTTKFVNKMLTDVKNGITRPEDKFSAHSSRGTQQEVCLCSYPSQEVLQT